MTADVLVEGYRVRYLRAGLGPPVVLIHGLVGCAQNWRLNIEALGRSFTVYAPDFLNMGESDRVPGLDASLEATADRLAAFMDALGLPPVSLAGHSYGGAVALSLAARHPGRVGRLVLFAPANPFCHLGRPLIRFYGSTVGSSFARLIPHLPRRAKAIALARMYGDPSRIPDDALGWYIDALAFPGTIRHILRILQSWQDDMNGLETVLPRLAGTPTLLIWGDRDRAVGVASGAALQRVLLQSRLVVIPGAGHIPFEEMPDVCNGAMLDFLIAPEPSPDKPWVDLSSAATCSPTLDRLDPEALSGRGTSIEGEAVPQPAPHRLLHLDQLRRR